MNYSIYDKIKLSRIDETFDDGVDRTGFMYKYMHRVLVGDSIIDLGKWTIKDKKGKVRNNSFSRILNPNQKRKKSEIDPVKIAKIYAIILGVIAFYIVVPNGFDKLIIILMIGIILGLIISAIYYAIALNENIGKGINIELLSLVFVTSIRLFFSIYGFAIVALMFVVAWALVAIEKDRDRRW